MYSYRGNTDLAGNPAKPDCRSEETAGLRPAPHADLFINQRFLCGFFRRYSYYTTFPVQILYIHLRINTRNQNIFARTCKKVTSAEMTFEILYDIVLYRIHCYLGAVF